jgi:glycosyltransferase involved in cell wall biosynthesis
VKTINILFISRGYPIKKYPMNGIFEYDQAKALSNYGHNVIFAFVDLRSIRRWRKWGFEKFKKDGIQHYGINIPLGRVPRKMLTFFGEHGLKVLYKRIEKEFGEPDIMHAHFTGSAYSAAKLKKNNKIPLVVTEHFSKIMAENTEDNLLNMAQFAYNNADRVISVSPVFQEIIKNKFNIDNTYIPNIVDTDIFKLETSIRSKSNEFNFVSVGNLIKHKRMHLTIKAFNQAFGDQNNINLTIIGGGPEHKNLGKQIKDLNLENRVKLTGRIDRKEIAKYFKQSDAFVLSSKGETFGVVFIEAMASGLPVIATRCGGPEHFITKEQGLLIEKDNLDQLSEAMTNMYNNINNYDSKKISQMTVEHFSPESVAEQITEVYKDVLDQ